MAGPTPVSSLLHSLDDGRRPACTSSPACTRCSTRASTINATASTSTSSRVIGGITIIIAAVLAFVQNDIKKVLAYSTVSQLGYMIMGLGVGAWVPAVFHIFTHAFFKSLPVPRAPARSATPARTTAST